MRCPQMGCPRTHRLPRARVQLFQASGGFSGLQEARTCFIQDKYKPLSWFLANQAFDVRTPERRRVTSVQHMKNHVRFFENSSKMGIFRVQQDRGVLVVGCSGLYNSSSFLHTRSRRRSDSRLCTTLGFCGSKLSSLLLLLSLFLGFGCLSPLLGDFS